MSVSERNKAFRQQVEQCKAVIREEAIEQNKGISIQAFYHQFTRDGNYAAAQALEELTPEIEAAGLNSNGHGPGTQEEQQREDLREKARREERERAQKRDREEVARMFGEGRRKAQGGIDLDAARNQPHGTAAVPSHTSNANADAEQRHREEMQAWEQRREEHRRSRAMAPFSEPAPVKPKKKQMTLLPY